jgi:hypothetical protein
MATPAGAQTFFDRYMTAKPPCFARAYLPEEMKRNPRQTVTNFFIWHAQPDPLRSEHPRRFEVEFGFRQKQNQDLFTARGACHDQGGTIQCNVESDGGSFTIEPNGDGLRVTIARIVVEGKRGVSPDLAKGDNRVMLLRSSPNTACSYRGS